MKDTSPQGLPGAEMFYGMLAEAGLCPASAWAKAEHFAQCLARVTAGETPREKPPLAAIYVPGRIEVLGKHTDYAGGRSLVAAADLGFTVVARARKGRRVRILNAAREDACEFELDAIPPPPPHTWRVYPLAVARRLERNFPGLLRGTEIAFLSDLPPAAGMSSSSALTIAIFLALAAASKLQEHPAYRQNIHGPEDLASYLAAIENGQSFGTLAGERGVGTCGGSEDHTAILCSRPGALVQYRYSPVVHERTIPLPQGLAFVVGISGVAADKNSAATQARYNRLSRMAAHLSRLWRQGTGGTERHLAAILASGPEALDIMRDLIRKSPPEPFPHEWLIRRLEQFNVENHELVEPAGLALERGDLAALAALADRSQRLAEDGLGNQVPETVRLQRSARDLGAPAASSFGAGFGGAVWALVGASEAPRFMAAWQERYLGEFPQTRERAAFHIIRPGPAAFTQAVDAY